MTASTESLGPQVERLRSRSLVVGCVGLVICGLIALANLQQVYESYLLAYLFWLNVALGCLPLLLLQHLTGGAWGMSIRRVLEAGTRTLLPLALLFVPILFGIEHLYLWAQPDKVAGDAILEHKALYLNVPFFVVRAVVYFAAWVALATIYSRWSRQQDETGDNRFQRLMEMCAGPGLVLYALTMTFASFDWVMSLDPHWFSHIFGALFGIRQVLAAFTFVIAMMVMLADREPMKQYLTPNTVHDLGKLLLAFIMVWAYFSFSQFLIIWAGNLPEEITWYLHRREGGFGTVGLLLIILHFVFPFCLLLSRDLKRSPKLLSGVALGVFAMRFLDLFWVVVPNFGHVNFGLHLFVDAIAFFGLGGLWFWLFLGQLEKRPLLPFRDPYFEETMGGDSHEH